MKATDFYVWDSCMVVQRAVLRGWKSPENYNTKKSVFWFWINTVSTSTIQHNVTFQAFGLIVSDTPEMSDINGKQVWFMMPIDCTVIQSKFETTLDKLHKVYSSSNSRSRAQTLDLRLPQASLMCSHQRDAQCKPPSSAQYSRAPFSHLYKVRNGWKVFKEDVWADFIHGLYLYLAPTDPAAQQQNRSWIQGGWKCSLWHQCEKVYVAIRDWFTCLVLLSSSWPFYFRKLLSRHIPNQSPFAKMSELHNCVWFFI